MRFIFFICQTMNIQGIKANLVKYIQNNRTRVLKFLVSGSSAAVINLGLLHILVAYLHFDTRFLENVANAVSMEASIIYNFLLSRFWTWNDAKREHGFNLIKQCFSFHAAVGVSICIRLIMFPILQLFGIHYLINAIIGIGIGATVSYILYDRVIFKERRTPFYD